MSFNQNPHSAIDNNSDVTVGRSDLTAPYSGAGPVPSGGFTPGSRLNNNFLLEKQLGRGGMGEAWKAYDETADRYVVLKFIPKELQHIQAAVDSVRDSFRKVHELQHQHICPVYGLFTDPDHGLYLAMKFIDGIMLDEYKRQQIKQNGKLSFSDTVQILWGIAKGLDYAHEKKVVHRDIKPQNVMISKKDGVQIIDFGLADEIRTSMAQFSQVVMEVSGTRPYMAPEQWRGRTQDARTDQYALAVTAYEIFSGHPPFRGNDIAVLRECVLKDAPEPIAGLPKYINAALLKALAKRRDDRFSDCKSFIRALAEKPKANSQVKPQEEAVQDEVQVSIVPHLPSDKNTGETQQPAWRPQTTNSSRGSVRSSNDNPLQKAFHLAIGNPLVLAAAAVLVVVLGVAGLFALFPSQSNDDDMQVITAKNTPQPSIIDTNEPTEEIQETGWTSLFNGFNLDGWKIAGDQEHFWKAGSLKADATTMNVLPLPANQTDNPSAGCLVNRVDDNWNRNESRKGGDIYTEQVFGDCTVNLEFLLTKGANSGIYLMGEYEIQVLDSYEKSNAELGQYRVMGAIFGVAKASMDVCKEPGTWQTCEIDFIAPKFDAAGKKTANAVFKKIVINGTVVHENLEIKAPTGGGLKMKEAATGPLMLQGSLGPIAFRNIKIRENKTESTKKNDEGHTPLGLANTEEKKQLLREKAGWVSLFDGKTLNGWKSNEPYEGFKVEDGCIVGFGARNHLYYIKEEFKNFELKIDCKINAEGDGGVYFKTAWVDASFPRDRGFELQMTGSAHQEVAKTGSLFGISNLAKAPVGDDEWFTYHLICRGDTLEVRLNGKVLYVYEDLNINVNRRASQKGYIALQQTGQASTTMFKNILLKKLPEETIAERPAPKDLLSALVRGTVDEVKFFLDRGDQLDVEAFAHQLPLIARHEAEGVTPLHVAAWFNPNVDVMKYLVSRGMNPHALNKAGAQPLQYAARNPHVEVLKYFISLGGGDQVKYNQWIMQDAAIYNTNVEVLKYVITLGGNVNFRGYMSGTPLHVAAQRNPNPEILEYLISQGADVNARDDNGHTPLGLANTEEKKQLLSERSGWFTIFGGIWKFDDNGVVSVNEEMGPKLFCSKKELLNLSRGEVSVEMFFPVRHAPHDQWTNAGLLIKVQEPGVGSDKFIGYEIALKPETSQIHIGFHRHNYKPLKDIPYKIPIERWFTFQVLFDETSFEVRIDGQSITKYVAVEPYILRTGGVALRTHNRSVQYRNWKITSDGNTFNVPLQQSTEAKSVAAEYKPSILTDEMKKAGWVSIFDGKTLNGWKSNNDEGGFKVEDGCIVGFGERNHLYHMEELQNFELLIDAKINKGGNGGVFIKAPWVEIAPPPAGGCFELQVNNSHRDAVKTGSLHGLKDLYAAPHGDDEWFTYHIICRGNTLEVRINGNLLYIYEDQMQDANRRISQKGHIVLQQYQIVSAATYKNIFLKKLPD